MFSVESDRKGSFSRSRNIGSKPGIHEDVAELYKEIFRLQTTIDEMNDHIAKVHKGEKIPFRKWSYLHIEPQPREPVVKKFKRFYDPFVSSTAEDAICNDSSPLNSIVKEIIGH